MELIAVNYGELFKSLLELREHCNDINKCMNDLQEEIESLDIFWDGDANTAFIIKITEDIAFINALILRIHANVRLLSEALRTYESCELEVRGLIDGAAANSLRV